MLILNNLTISLAENDKAIIKNFNLNINEGEVHLLNGKNGSGKSTLVNAVMGNPLFKISNGEILLKQETYEHIILEKIDREYLEDKVIKVTNLEPNLRSQLGIFLANQYPVEIPGVSLTSYLRMIYNSKRTKEEQLPVFKFKKILEEKALIINYPKELLSRNLNEGFSGGEKKKTEILQMLVLEPRFVMLDEIDSGLDKHAVKEIFEGLVAFRKVFPKTSFIIITHYDRFKDYIIPDFTHEMDNGILLY